MVGLQGHITSLNLRADIGEEQLACSGISFQWALSYDTKVSDVSMRSLMQDLS